MYELNTVVEPLWNDTEGRITKYADRTCPIAIFPSKNPKRTGLWSNPRLLSERLLTNHLCYGMDFLSV
jgi:hypothetical protein